MSNRGPEIKFFLKSGAYNTFLKVPTFDPNFKITVPVPFIGYEIPVVATESFSDIGVKSV